MRQCVKKKRQWAGLPQQSNNSIARKNLSM
jgi:hypothetical protein